VRYHRSAALAIHIRRSSCPAISDLQFMELPFAITYHIKFIN